MDRRFPIPGQPAAQAIIVPGATRTDDTDPIHLTLLLADGTPYNPLQATQAEAQDDSTAADVPGVVADLNTLLANLRAAKIMAES